MTEYPNALIVSNFVRFYNSLIPILKNQGFGEIFFAVNTSEAKRILMTKDISAVLINTPLSDTFGIDLAYECATEKSLAVMMFVSKEFFEQTIEKTSALAILILQKPNLPETISQSVKLLYSTAVKLRQFKKCNQNTPEKAEQFRLISRAKLILISSFGMTEEQAHKYVERRAMEERKTKEAISQSIINSYGN